MSFSQALRYRNFTISRSPHPESGCTTCICTDRIHQSTDKTLYLHRSSRSSCSIRGQWKLKVPPGPHRNLCCFTFSIYVRGSFEPSDSASYSASYQILPHYRSPNNGCPSDLVTGLMTVVRAYSPSKDIKCVQSPGNIADHAVSSPESSLKASTSHLDSNSAGFGRASISNY